MFGTENCDLDENSVEVVEFSETAPYTRAVVEVTCLGNDPLAEVPLPIRVWVAAGQFTDRAGNPNQLSVVDNPSCVAIDPANTAVADCASDFLNTAETCATDACIYTDTEFVLQSDRRTPIMTVVGITSDLEYDRGDDHIVEPRWATVESEIWLEIEFSQDIRMPVVTLATQLCVPHESGVCDRGEPGVCCIEHDHDGCPVPRGANECSRFFIRYTVPDDAAEELPGVSLSALFEATTTGVQSAYWVGSDQYAIPASGADLQVGPYEWTETATGGSPNVWSDWLASGGGIDVHPEVSLFDSFFEEGACWIFVDDEPAYTDLSAETAEECANLGQCTSANGDIDAEEATCTTGGVCSLVPDSDSVSVSSQSECEAVGLCSVGELTDEATCLAREVDATWEGAEWLANVWIAANTEWVPLYDLIDPENLLVRIDVTDPQISEEACGAFPQDRDGQTMYFTTDPEKPYGTQSCGDHSDGVMSHLGGPLGYTWQPAGDCSDRMCEPSDDHTSHNECSDVHLAEAIQFVFEHSGTSDDDQYGASRFDASDPDTGGSFLRIIPRVSGDIPTLDTEFAVTPCSELECPNPEAKTAIELTIFDAAGNSASCSTTMSIEDDEPPILSCEQLVGPEGRVNVVSSTSTFGEGDTMEQPVGTISMADDPDTDENEHVVTAALVYAYDNVQAGECIVYGSEGEDDEVTSAMTQDACDAIGFCNVGLCSVVSLLTRPRA